MRRALAILFVLFYGFGPFAIALAPDQAARLPACCRRNGAHRCAMSDAELARAVRAVSGATPILTAPSHCPLYPNSTPAPTSSGHAQASAHANAFSFSLRGPVFSKPSHAPASQQTRHASVRGPPAPAIS